ncbi:MAG: YggS family pyridoxal phosphate-dependent enzyme [Aquificae bacterium]|nr:YggS family pyridoxal phosphate-dependent enzyme [Aquificota bacterium]
MEIKERVRSILDRIHTSAKKVGRNPEEVILLAASKTQPVEKIREAFEGGIRYFGENRVQEGMKKIQQLTDLPIHWHLIGGLQTNKVKYAVKHFEMIHSLDRKPLADEIDKRAGKIGKIQPVLIEVNVGEEESKYGVSPSQLKELFEYTLNKGNIKVEGLMCIPPYSEDKEASRGYFAQLREMRDSLEREFGVKLPHLSMGMSHDFDVAVEEGATIVRVGTAIFGERQY